MDQHSQITARKMIDMSNIHVSNDMIDTHGNMIGE